MIFFKAGKRSLAKIFIILCLCPNIISVSCSNTNKNIPYIIRFGVSKAVIAAPVLLADAFGFFNKHGLKIIKSDYYKSGKAAFFGMLENETDISTVASTPVALASFKNKTFSVIATYTTSYNGVKIIARQTSGIKAIKDIKGKRIGVIEGTISHLLFTSFLVFNKIGRNDVKIINCLPGEVISKLSRGEIDAVSIWEPDASKILDVFKDAIRIPTKNVYRIAINLAANSLFLKNNKEALYRVLSAIKETIDYMHANEKQSKKTLSSMLNLSRKQVEKSWMECNYKLSLDNLLLITLELEAKWAIRYKYVKEKSIPNYLKVVNTEILSRVSPESVSISR
jgi:NitT/TauT family transport system substrate-binding protein